MTKKERQQVLKSLILEHEFDTQNDLVDFLNKKGLNVTQATVSRDIKELGIIKVKSNNKYKYSIIEKNNSTHKNYTGIVLDIVCAQNIVVVKTSVGSANSICIVIDKAQIDGIIGTVAGDDTIFIVAPNNEKAISVSQELKRILK